VIRRLPIRWRLTLAFALAMALVLAVVAIFLRVSLANELDDGIDTSLGTRADELAALAGEGGGSLGGAERRLSELEEGFAQVLDHRGGLLDASSPQLRRPLLEGADLRRAAGGAVTVERAAVPGVDGPARLLARPAGAGERIVVVGTSLEDRDEAVAGLTGLLLVAGPVALAAAAILGYLLAAAALRPVEAMRARASEISGARAGARLPLPEARDELRRLGETLNAMLERIDAALGRERAFVADASHELRTPVAILKAEIDLALAGERTPQELRAALASAREETERLARLADDLLVLARMEGGTLPIHRERLEAREVLEAVSARFAARAADEGRSIEVVADPGAVVVADRLRIEQAITNLVDNALRHGAGPVVVRARRVGEAVELSVEDAGAGVPPDEAEGVFGRFVRGASAASGSGAGLGLSIVRAIARAHGGDARIEGGAGAAAAVIRLPG
jgi:two-component system, OmpR family, sensor kinase